MYRQLSFAALVGAFLTGSGVVHADAALQSSNELRFPTAVAIDAHIRAQIEVTTMTLTFADLERGGDYVLTVPGPKGASATGVDMDRGTGFEPLVMTDETPPPGVGSGAQADPEVAVWQGNTPLLVDMAGLQPGPLVVRVQFLRILRRYQGSVAFSVGAARCPLRDLADTGAALSLSVTLDTLRPRTLLTASPSASVLEESETRARVQAVPGSLDGGGFIDITYREDIDGISAHFLAHRTPTADPLADPAGDHDGYFLLIVDADEVTVEDTTPRTLNLVVDRSGSMTGDKMAQARDAARAMLDNLRPDDDFNIAVFDDQVSSMWSQPRPATSANIEHAREYIKDIEADGSTNLDQGIIAGLGGSTTPDDDRANARFDALVLLSDGQATAGETDPTAIHRRSIEFNQWKSRIFTVAVGFGADIPLMQALARSSRGKSFTLNEAQATSELVATARILFEDIQAVRLTDMQVALAGIETADTLPQNPPDLFNGGQVLLVGRYRQAGSGSATVTGDANGVPYQLDVPLSAPGLAEDAAFIKYVWATEKVGRLLADMAMGGDQQALRAQITELGLAYRIQTPFTSFSSVPADAAFGQSDVAGCGCRADRPGRMPLAPFWLLLVGLYLALWRRHQASRAVSRSSRPDR